MTLNHSTSITTIWLIWIFSMMICNNKEIGRRKIISLSYWIQHLCKVRTVQFSCSVVFSSLQPHQTQHARPPCPSPTSGVHPNPCPLSWWCHPTISSSVIPFSSCLQSSPVSGSFQINQLFASGGQSIGVSVSTSVLAMKTQDWSPLGWIGWISL